MSRVSSRFASLALFSVGLLCIVRGVSTADPPFPQGCWYICQAKTWFADVTTGSAHEHIPGDCRDCLTGGCLVVPSTDPPSCEENKETEFTYNVYLKKGVPLCDNRKAGPVTEGASVQGNWDLQATGNGVNHCVFKATKDRSRR